MGDFRAELAALVAAYDKHESRWPQADVDALYQAVERARAVLAAAPQIEAPHWCETDAEQYAWQAGWEARDDAMLQPSLPLARLPENAQVIEPANHTILAPIPTPIPVSERLPRPEDCDAEGRCWWGDAGDDQFVPSWRLCEQPDDTHFTHWLPAHALPLPEVE